MKAGALRHLVTIERRTDTFDGYGEGQPTWEALLSDYPASVRDDTQREFTGQLQAQTEKSIHIELRDPRVAITARDRVTFEHPVNGATVYDIRAVLGGDNNARTIVLMCSEHSSE